MRSRWAGVTYRILSLERADAVTMQCGIFDWPAFLSQAVPPKSSISAEIMVMRLALLHVFYRYLLSSRPARVSRIARPSPRSMGYDRRRCRPAHCCRVHLCRPARRRRHSAGTGGRPVTPGEMKRYPLSLYVTKALKDQLVEASKASGRPLTGEIEARLQRTLEEDRPKDSRSIRIDALANKMKKDIAQMFEYWENLQTTLKPDRFKDLLFLSRFT